MNANGGIHRIAIALHAIGVAIMLLGIVGIITQAPGGHLVPIVVMSAILAAPFFVVAWIFNGFASREQKQAEALIAEMRRNAELGRRWQAEIRAPVNI